MRTLNRTCNKNRRIRGKRNWKADGTLQEHRGPTNGAGQAPTPKKARVDRTALKSLAKHVKTTVDQDHPALKRTGARGIMELG